MDFALPLLIRLLAPSPPLLNKKNARFEGKTSLQLIAMERLKKRVIYYPKE